MFPIDTSNLKIIRYRRKSTEDEDRQVASLGDQATALGEVVTRLRINASQIVADFGESRSAKLSHTRPEFQKMVEMINRGEANAILSWHPDRLSRNLGDVDTLIGLMESRRLFAIITPQYMFGDSPTEKYILISECTRAKLENDNRGVNVRRGLLGKIRKGWRPGKAPIGYLNDVTKLRGERDLLPDPERFNKVKRLFKLFLTGQYSVRQLQRIAANHFLLRTHSRKREGGRPVHLSLIYRVLTSPFYYGKFLWSNPQTGEKELYQGKHEPMISEEEFWRIQVMLGNGRRPQAKKLTFAYTALMTCGECRSQITAEEKWQLICGRCKTKFASRDKTLCPGCGDKLLALKRKTVLHYVYYHCTKSKGPCSQRAVRVEVLESEFDRLLSRFNVSEKYVRWAVGALREESKNDTIAGAQVKRNLRHEHARLAGQLDELNRFIIRQESAGWVLMTKEEALAEKQRLRSALAELDEPVGQGVSDTNGVDDSIELMEYASRARLWLKTGTNDQKREIVSSLGSNLMLKDKKLSIDLHYPLSAIERMIEIAPEIISSFEPAESANKTRLVTPFATNIPILRGQLNAIRTYFAKSQAPFRVPKNADFRRFLTGRCSESR